MGLCQQKQYYTKLDQPKNKNILFDPPKYVQKPFLFDNQTQQKSKQDLKFQESFKRMQEKKKKQDLKFQEFLKKQQQKKRLEDKKFMQFLKNQQTKKKLKPNQTQMAKLLYAYGRHYGGPPDYRPEIKTFVQQNYSPQYCSQLYKLNSSYPITTSKSQVIDRLKTAHQKGLISDHFNFIEANQEKKYIKYTWTVRVQLTNHRTLYECEATFDNQKRFLKVVLKQTDTYNYRPPPPPPPQQKKISYAYQKPQDTSYYVKPSIDYGAAQAQRSKQRFRENMNRQAQDWNNYVRQKNARGW